MPVRVRGEVYPSARAAAEALNVKPISVYCAISRGNPDRIGLGPDYKARETKGGLPPKPVQVGSIKFPSIAALARLIGRNPRHVRVSLRSGELAQERIARAVMAALAKQENAALKRRPEK